MWRVLRPGGRFLMVVRVPGWTAFTVASVFSFLLTPKAGWRRLALRAGFAVADEGVINYGWFVVHRKPGPSDYSA